MERVGHLAFSPPVILRARQGIEDGLVERDAEYPAIWWVRSRNSDSTYRVQSDFDPAKGTLTWITCTCAHGLNVGAGQTHCWHAAAVLLRIRDEIERTP